MVGIGKVTAQAIVAEIGVAHARRLAHQIERLGYKVTVEPVALPEPPTGLPP